VSKNFKAYTMLVLATFFWSGNFIVGKFAFLQDIPPLSLVFFRWLTVWLILLPFTFKEILMLKKKIFKNFPLLLLLGLTSVGLFNSIVYLSLSHTQVINASLFNTAIPAVIILVCFLFKIEKTNFYQLLGLFISVVGILFIITKADLNILLNLNFNVGDLLMVVAVISWGIYSAFLKKFKLKISLLCFVHIICSLGLLFVIPQFLYEFIQGDLIKINKTFFYLLFFLALFPSIGSMYCWAGAVSIIGPNRAGIFLSLIPLFSTLMAIIFFEEIFKIYHFFGASFIILGIMIANISFKKYLKLFN
tara:strand:+ start:883 stop:1794 length:912 start_codon:yes stop_codon:yes gene_type:complete